MWVVVFPFLFLGISGDVLLENDLLDKNEIKIEHYVYWPNGTIPFYIHPDHFDHEQTSVILTALTTFAYKTCLKFLPALVAPTDGQHVLVVVNPNGVRQCVISTTGHARDEPHYLSLGYDCLQSPNIDMMLMKTLGFGFEHNRAIRDLYIRVQKENINPSAMDLFVMDDKLPPELRALPYDVNSVMHFGDRDFSKNGHRTMLILDHKVKQCREGLSDFDLRKIDIVYGPECRKRDRLEKIDLCQGYPSFARRKRSADELAREKRDEEPTEVKSLRVNPDITPPPELLNATENEEKYVNKIMDELGLNDGVEEVTNLVYKLGAQALTNFRLKHCNVTNTTNEEVKTESGRRSEEKKPDIFGVVEVVAEYVKDMVDQAHSNLTAFCEGENDLRAYQRQGCNWNFGPNRCPVSYRSTKSGPVMYSTKHRPYIVQSTKHEGEYHRIVLYHQGRRDDGHSETPGDGGTRRKRDAGSNDGSARKKRDVERFERRRYNVSNRSDGAKWDESEVSMEKERQGKNGNPSRQNNGKEEARGLGDVKMSGPLPKTVELSKKNREFYGERMWPEGVVRYILTQDKKYDLVDLRRRLDAVNRILKERTCVSLEEITEEDAERFEDYLVLDGSADYITGKVGGRQNFGSLELFEGGQHKQHAAMMVMAMLGFYFELARHDRDAHVRVHMRHVRPDKLHHFEKIRSDATLPLPYDFESATHPAWQFWRQIGRTGISTVATYKEKDPDGTLMRALGQHDRLLSETDIIKINSVYGVKCFEKKPERNNDDIDHGSVIQEVDLDKDERKKHHDTKPKDSYKLEVWERQSNERQKYSDEERHHRDREEHERNKDRHRIKHGLVRDDETDDRSTDYDMDRGRSSNKHKRIRNKHEQDRDESRGKYERKHEKRDQYRQESDDRIDREKKRREKYRDMHQKRPRESDEDREEQERLRSKHRHVERGRDIHNEYETDRDRYRENGREVERHGRYQKRAEEKSKNHHRERNNHRKGKRHGKRDDIGITIENNSQDRGSGVEEVVIYKQRNQDDVEQDNYRKHHIQVDRKEKTLDNNPDDDRPLQTSQDEIRREQIFAPVTTKKHGTQKM